MTTAEQAPTVDAAQPRIIGVLSIAQVVGGVGNGAVLSVGALLIKDVSGSSGWAGMATVMLTLGAAAVTMPLARLAAARGRRPSLALSWFLAGLGALVGVLGAITEALPLVLLSLALSGAGSAAQLQSRFAAVDRAAPHQVGRALSLVVWSTAVGAVIGPNLTGPGASLARTVGVPDLAGPLLFAAAGFVLAGAVTTLLLRPDPLAGRAVEVGRRAGMREALPLLRGTTAAAVTVIATTNAALVAVMSLTPIHMQDHGSSLSTIGVAISLCIAGMFGLSPLMGWATDILGPVRVIFAGQLLLLMGVLMAGISGDSALRIVVGLVLLGIGWSASVIAGATLLTSTLAVADRPTVQGFSDLAMNLAGAAGGLVAGLVVAASGFGTLNAVAALLAVPAVAVVLMTRRRPAIV